MATDNFLACEFMKHLKLEDKEKFTLLNDLYNKETLTTNELEQALYIFFYGQKILQCYLPVDIFISTASEIFIMKHIEIAKYEFVSNIYNLILSQMTYTDRLNKIDNSISVSNLIYDSMFHVLAKTNQFDYWLEHIEYIGLSDLDFIENYNAKERLAKTLISNGLLNSIESPVYNLVLLFLCGIALDDKYFLFLYNKGKILFSDEFKLAYSDYLRHALIPYKNPLFKEFSTICEKVGYQINHARNLYSLLNKRSEQFEYKIPNELINFYLMEDLRAN